MRENIVKPETGHLMFNEEGSVELVSI